jgi:hypothetical protein
MMSCSFMPINLAGFRRCGDGMADHHDLESKLLKRGRIVAVAQNAAQQQGGVRPALDR